MARRDYSFTDASGIIGNALKVAESQISGWAIKQRIHRQRVPVECEKHLKDTIQKIRKLDELFSQIKNPLNDSSLSPYFFDYRNKFFKSLTDLSQQFGSYIRAGSKNYEKETFNKYAAFFYHMSEELNFLFPNGIFVTNQVFARKEAQNWWESNFHSNVAVSSDEFCKQFKKAFPDVNEDGAALIDTIGFSSPDYVSKYDLDIFTRLFGAWPFLTRVWRRLVNHPAYQKYGTFSTTHDVLDGYRTTPGSYIFRISMSRNGYWSIGYVSAEGKIIQVLCVMSPLAEYLCYGKQQGLFKYPKGQACLDDLSDVVNMRVKLELQHHRGDEDSLKCKICGVFPNDTQLEPCGHLICSYCCRRIQSSASCYRCNSKILCTTPVEIQMRTVDADKTSSVSRSSSKGFSGSGNSDARCQNGQDCSPLRFQNSPNRGRPKNQDILRVAERVATACHRDQEAVEADLRILFHDGFELEQVAEALISAGGDRAKAKELLQNHQCQNGQDCSPLRFQNSPNR